MRLYKPYMIILFHCMSARSFRPLWTLEELGLPYELHMLPFPPRAHARQYLNVNPLGTVLAYWQRLQTGAGYQRALDAQQKAALAQGVPETPAPLVLAD